MGLNYQKEKNYDIISFFSDIISFKIHLENKSCPQWTLKVYITSDEVLQRVKNRNKYKKNVSKKRRKEKNVRTIIITQDK